MHSTELHLEQNFYASVIIAFIVISEIRKQLVRMWQFHQTIPESMSSLQFWVGFLVNIIIALSLIPINIIIIAMIICMSCSAVNFKHFQKKQTFDT